MVTTYIVMNIKNWNIENNRLELQVTHILFI